MTQLHLAFDINQRCSSFSQTLTELYHIATHRVLCRITSTGQRRA